MKNSDTNEFKSHNNVKVFIFRRLRKIILQLPINTSIPHQNSSQKKKIYAHISVGLWFMKPYSIQQLIQVRQMLPQNCPVSFILQKCMVKFEKKKSMPINFHAKKEITLFFRVIYIFLHQKQADKSRFFYFVYFPHRQCPNLTHQVQGAGSVHIFGSLLAKININT